MSDVIIVEYQAKIDKLSKDLDALEKELKGVDTASKKSMNTLEKESKEAGTAVQKVDKNVVGLNDKLKGLANNIPGAFAVQEVLGFGEAIIGGTKAVAGMSNGMKILKFAIASTGIGLLIVAVGSLIAYFKSTEEGGDKLAKVMRVLGGIFGEVTKELAKIGSVLFDAAEGFVNLVSGTDNAAKSTDDYKKSVIELSSEIADLEDKISALTFSVALQNEKLQTGIDTNLKALRNRNITLKESLGIIKQVGDLEQEKLKNTNGLLDEEVRKEKLIFLQKTKEFEEEQKTTVVTRAQARRQEGESDEQWRARLNRLKIERDAARKAFAERQILFDKFTKGELTALEFNDKAKGVYKEEDAHRITDILIRKEQATREALVLDERLNNFEDAALEKDKAKRAQKKADQDKDFQDRIALINKITALEIREAKIAGANQIELVSIERKANQEKLELFRKYGKDKGIEYQNLLLNEKEFDADIVLIVKNGLEKQKAEDEKAAKDLKSSRVKSMQDFVKDNKEKNDALKKQNDDFNKDEEKRLKEHRANMKAILQASIQIAGDVLHSITQNKLNNDQLEIASEQKKNEKQTESQLTEVDKRLAAGKISAEAAAAQKEAINARSAQKDAALKLKAWKAQQIADVRTAEINAAVSIGKTFATYGFTPPGFIAAAAAFAEGLLLVATIKSRKPPQFAEGGEIKGKSHREGGTIIEAERGEFVVKKSQYAKHKDLINDINDGKPLDHYFMKDPAGIIMAKQMKERMKEKQLADLALRSQLNRTDIDLNHLERLTKGNNKVSIKNADEIAHLIAKKLGGFNPEMK